uniref:Uncharacterized protein n=1 Tax=Anguilla anguilla TaxID=7936 RepID=A0A0E9QEL9_ANGAN
MLGTQNLLLENPEPPS